MKRLHGMLLILMKYIFGVKNCATHNVRLNVPYEVIFIDKSITISLYLRAFDLCDFRIAQNGHFRVVQYFKNFLVFSIFD